MWALREELLCEGCAQRPAYLGEGQAVLVLVSVLHLKVIQGFALGRGGWQGPETLHIAGGQEAVGAAQFPVEPVLVHPASKDDDVSLVELEVTRLLPLVTVEGFATGKLGRILKAKHKAGYSTWPFCCLGGLEHGLRVRCTCRMPSSWECFKGTDPCPRNMQPHDPAWTTGSTRGAHDVIPSPIMCVRGQVLSLALARTSSLCAEKVSEAGAK